MKTRFRVAMSPLSRAVLSLQTSTDFTRWNAASTVIGHSIAFSPCHDHKAAPIKDPMRMKTPNRFVVFLTALVSVLASVPATPAAIVPTPDQEEPAVAVLYPR